MSSGDEATPARESRASSCMLSARSLMETFAVMAEFERRVTSLLKEENLGGLDALAQNGIFASRDLEWLKENPDTQAINVQTYIDKFDKRAEGFRGQYDRLSERCHPNSLGHNFMFSEAAPGLRRGDPVRIARGIFTGELALYDGMRPHERVGVLLRVLGRVELPAGDVVPI
jgi:hypothetical protein